MTVTKLIEQVSKDREELNRVSKALADIVGREKAGHGPTIAGWGMPNILLTSGLSVSQEVQNTLTELVSIISQKIERNNKILATADSLVRGLSMEPEE